MFDHIQPPEVADFGDWTRFIFMADTLAYSAYHAVPLCDIFVDRGILNCNCSPKSGQGIVCCDCSIPCDYDEDSFLTALDAGALIDVLFAGVPEIQDPYCPTSRGDFDCDGFPTALDLDGLIDHLFAGQAGPCDPCTDIP